MNVRVITKLLSVALLVGVAGCEIQKSASPLSPSVAGPLPGVTINAPRPLEPSNGAEVLSTSLPLKLVFQNASSNSPRPFWHVVEIAADAGFTNKLYASERLDPDTSGRSTHTVPGRLADGVTYYWRVRAEDGANASEPSQTVYFAVVEPVILDPPVPVSPIGGVTTSNRSPDFVVNNGNVSGPAGTVSYSFEVSNDQGFASRAATGTAVRGSGTTKINLGQLAENKTFYWRAVASNGKVFSSYSSIQIFKTPAPAPTPSPTPGGGCGKPASGWPSNGPAVIAYVRGCYPSYLAAGVTSSQRRSNMEFLRDRIIETGICGGMDLGWNLKRGGPEISADFLVYRQGGTDDGVDVAFDYDNTSTPLVLQWLDGAPFPYYTRYTPRPSCQ